MRLKRLSVQAACDALGQGQQVEWLALQLHGVGAGQGEHLVGLADGVVHLG